jgi:formylglycine-generating enzyme required for sulfatase activity
MITCDKCSTQGIPNEAIFCPYCGYQLKPGHFEYVNFGINPDNKLFTVNGISFKMIKVEGGTFLMGAHTNQERGLPIQRLEEARPIHSVTLNSYYIAETEVTQELWQVVMGSNPSKFRDNASNPVENISPNDCEKFICQLNNVLKTKFRLPTEAEWEFAARGGNKSKGYKYAGSNNIGDIAWYKGNSGNRTHPVKMKFPNELGLYDMTGNVWEICNDWWYYKYPRKAQKKPQGPNSGYCPVFRGGCFCNNSTIYSSVRDFGCYADEMLGIRLALSEP